MNIIRRLINFSFLVLLSLVLVSCGQEANRNNNTALAGPIQISGADSQNGDSKVSICHIPPGNPANAHTIEININALPAHLAHGDTAQECQLPPTAAEIDPPEVIVDTQLIPITDELAGVDNGPARQLGRIHAEIGDGYDIDFVENEVYLITDDEGDVNALLARWGGNILFQATPPGDGSGVTPSSLYLISIDPSSADTSNLDEDLAALSPQLHGLHRISSETGRRLLALVASEIITNGLRLGINVLLESQGIAERETQEAEIGVNVGSFVYDRNGFVWPYMERDPDLPGDSLWPLDTGVAEAHRVTQAATAFGNRVRVLIADGGFYPNADFPPFTPIGPMRTPNPDPTNCGTGGPISAECAAHGTHVTLSGFGLPDNSFGTFGPGGPVSDMILLQSPSIDVATIARFIIESIPDALSLRPNIINLSASTSIPGGWCFIVCEALDLLSEILDDNGIIFVAAAGNDSIDVDATDEICFLGCIEFEEAAIIPCETDRVVCVGAHRFDISGITGYSNFGRYLDDNSVDIFAPGDLYSVTALNADENLASPVDDLKVINGTSFASPFVAGVMALTWSGDRTLTDDEVRDCVLDNAHITSLTGEPRRVDAMAAVQCALGDTHPFLNITFPEDGHIFQRGVESILFAADADDYEDGEALTINWNSNLNGDLGSTAPGDTLNLGALGLSIGEHEICASLSDSALNIVFECIDVSVTGANPVVTLVEPVDSAEYFVSSTIPLFGTVIDPDSPGIPDLAWYVRPPFDPLGTPILTGSPTGSISGGTLAPGNYWVTLVATDADGNDGSDTHGITILEDPTDNPPDVTILQPINGAEYEYNGAPIRIRLEAFASDVEDGTIPFTTGL